MPKSPHPHLDRARELEAKVEEAKRRPAELRAERHELARQRKQLKDDLTRFYSLEQTPEVVAEADGKRKALAEVEQRLLAVPWDEATRGAEIAASRAESEFEQLVADHHEELQAEIAATLGHASHERLTAVVDEVIAAIDEDNGVRHLMGRYLLIGDRPNAAARQPAENILTGLRRDLRHIQREGLEPPALRDPADEDPTIRAEQFNGAAVVRR